MKIAQVGAFKKYSTNDVGRMLTVATWFFENGVWKANSKEPITHDIVNLEYKRDFLRERRIYDTVILHSIMHSNRPDILRDLKNHVVRDKKIFGYNERDISALHSVERWRKRLISSKATYIFVFEDIPFSLNIWTLGKLKGYIMPHMNTQYGFYKKEEEK